jgi:two-component system response regulator AlgR
MIPTVFILDDEAPARLRMRTLLSDIAVPCPTHIVGEADQAQLALDAIAVCRPDIVLLDVQMPGISGIEFARHLLQNSPAENGPTVIFVSAHDAYALQAFEVQAFDYLLKPVRAQRLQEAILRAVRMRVQLSEAANQAPKNHNPAVEAELALQGGRQFFSVMERGRILLVPVSEVLYIKAEQKYLTLHTRQQQYLIEESLQAIELEMPAVLVRIHRNTLIARAALSGVERGMEMDEQTGKMTEAWQVILLGSQDRLPISRRLWPSIKALVK